MWKLIHFNVCNSFRHLNANQNAHLSEFFIHNYMQDYTDFDEKEIHI